MQQGTTGTVSVLDGANVDAGALIDITNLGTGGTATEAFTFSVDLSELTDMTQTLVSTDEFVALDSGAQRRKAASEIGLSVFNNDSGYITSVPAQTFASLTGKPTTLSGYGITDAFDGAYSSLTGTPRPNLSLIHI